MQVDNTDWSGEGTLTAACLEALQAIDPIDTLRVEDAPASRADAGFSFISNEIYVHAPARVRLLAVRVFGCPVWVRRIREPALTIESLERRLAACPEIGDADFVDDGMIQYLRTERIVPPYQTRGIKVVEMVRIYLVPPARARTNDAAPSRRQPKC